MNNSIIIPGLQEQIDIKVRQEVQKELKSLSESLSHQLVSIQMQVRQEIFQSFKLITGIIVEQEFAKTYGNSFVLSSLQDSLIYIPSSTELEPSLSYDSSVFRFNDKIQRERNKFNQNARRWERKNRRFLDQSFYVDTGGLADFYDQDDFDEYIDSNIIDEDDYMEELLMDYDDITFNSKRNPTDKVNLIKTYKNAIKKAQIGFSNEWKRSIKNRLEKKYKIIIN